MTYIILGLGMYFFTVNAMYKQHHTMRHGIIQPRTLLWLVDLNEYLAVFPGAKISDKMFMTELNEILLNSIPNSWNNQAYVKEFDCESITFKASVNMFERMEISEYIYEVVV